MRVNDSPEQDLEYVGFWIRVGTGIIDAVLLMLVVYPVLISVYGWAYFDISQTRLVLGPVDFLMQWAFPAIATVVFWITKQATPGKMAVSAKIVDAKNGGAPSSGQFVGRYLAYILSGLPLGLGFLWIAFDKRKQGWHDKLAGTVVVRRVRLGASED